MEIQEKALPLHSVISFSVINYVVSMRGPHVSGDNLFFYALQPASELVQASACLSLIHGAMGVIFRNTDSWSPLTSGFFVL